MSVMERVLAPRRARGRVSPPVDLPLGEILAGDCIQHMKSLPAGSIDMRPVAFMPM